MPIIRKFVLNCIDKETCMELVNTLLENLPATTYLSYRLRGDKLEITVYGLKHEVQNIWSLIKYYYSNVLKIMSQKYKEYKEYPIDYIVSKTRRTFPPDILVEILKVKGFHALHEDNIIKTNAPIEEVLELASKIAELLDKIKYDVRGKATKKVVVLTSLLLKMDPNDAINRLLNEGILRKDDEGKPILAIDKETAITRIKTIFKQLLH